MATNKRTNIVAMIPARIGSTRLAMKNLALLNGKPLIYYAINAAKRAGTFDRIVLNSESDIFSAIAKRYGIEFYKRPDDLGSSEARSDSVVHDFIKNNPCDIVAWVNTTSPLQTGEEVRSVAQYFIDNKLDSLITVKNEQVHCVYGGRPVNYDARGLFARTQDLEPVQPFVYSVMMWRSNVFMKTFEKKGFALFCGKTGFYPVSKLSSIVIKREDDLMLAHKILRDLSHRKRFTLKYDRLALTGRGR